MEITLDFETRSRIDLRKVSTERYAEDETTEVLCLAWGAVGEEPELWVPGEADPLVLREAIEDPDVIFVAHKADFEMAIWRHHMVKKYGFQPIPIERWRCTMASCAYKAIPQKLEKAGEVLELPVQKDAAGHTLMLKLCKPWRGREFINDYDLHEKNYEYCRQDVRAEVCLDQYLGPLPAVEQKVWELTQRMNERGIPIDREALTLARKRLDEVSNILLPKLAEATKGQVVKAGDIVKLVAFCRENGVEIPDMKADTVDYWLDEADLEDGAVRTILTIRRTLGKASVKKIARMENMICADGRIHDTLAYHGAATGRWAGRGVQFHNFPRPASKHHHEVLVSALGWPLNDVEELLGEPMFLLADTLRSIVKAPDGYTLPCADYSSIEARIVMWLAGETAVLGEFRDGVDIYCSLAEEIFARPITKKADPEERTAGKTGILGLGYQMGERKLYSKGIESGADPKFWTPALAMQTKMAYREKYWRVPLLWAGLNDAAMKAVTQAPKAFGYAGILFVMRGEWLACRLPSGRALWYYEPIVKDRRMPWWTEEKPVMGPALFYYAQKKGRWWKQVTYGGKLTENVVQAIARDLMVDAMIKCEGNGLPLILTVHDELLAEVNLAGPGHKDMVQIMRDIPSWAAGLPVDAEGWTDQRWRKG